MAIYFDPNSRKIAPRPEDRFNNQIIFSGENEKYPVNKGIFYLEYVEAISGTTVTIKDGKGKVIIPSIDTWGQDYSPIRCEYGIEFVGDLKLAKGFYMPNVFSE